MRFFVAKLALIFPGQGSQVVGMGKDFFENFRESALVYEEASDTLHLDLRKLCFEGPLGDLTLTHNLQPSLFVTEAAILAAVRANMDFKPVVVAGHSLGEYSALYSAGALSLSDGVTLTRERGTQMQKAVAPGKGAMAAVLGLDEAKVNLLCERARHEAKGEVVEPANFNAPGQIVIAGTADGIGRAMSLLKEEPEFKGGKSIPLQVSAPFHCSLMLPAQKVMAPLLASTRFSKPLCPIIANVTAQPNDSEHAIGGLLTDQITRAVRWEQSMKLLRGLGVQDVLEIGPGKVLAGLNKRIDREMPVRNISSVEQFREVLK